MEKINISYSNLGTYVRDGERVPIQPKTDADLQIVDLKEVWTSQTKLNPDDPKGANGMIIPFAIRKFYSIEYIRKEHLCTNGIVFVDIDCGEDLVEPIFKAIPECNLLLCNSILGVAKTKKGLHVLFMSNPMIDEEFSDVVFTCLTSLARAIEIVTGIDLRKVDKALDGCTFSIKQRLFLRYSNEVYWNDRCQILKISKQDKAKLIETYPELYKRVRNRRRSIVYEDSNKELKKSYKANLVKIVPVEQHEYIEHYQRWSLFDSLYWLFSDDKEELEKQWNRCCELIRPDKHSITFFKEEPAKDQWYKEHGENGRPFNSKILEEFGYIVEDVQVECRPVFADIVENIDRINKMMELV